MHCDYLRASRINAERSLEIMASKVALYTLRQFAPECACVNIEARVTPSQSVGGRLQSKGFRKRQVRRARGLRADALPLLWSPIRTLCTLHNSFRQLPNCDTHSVRRQGCCRSRRHFIVTVFGWRPCQYITENGLFCARLSGRFISPPCCATLKPL